MNKFFRVTKGAFEKEEVKTLQELWNKKKGSFDGLCEDHVVDLKMKSANLYSVIFSTSSVDRDREVIFQNFELDNFKKNPVLLDSHRYDSIDRVIGKIDEIGIIEGKLQGDISFAIDNPRGLLAKNLVDKGFLGATSIGFIPKQFDADGNPTLSELLEVSVVSVPANPEALFKSVKDMNGQPAEEVPEVGAKDAEEEEKEVEEVKEEEEIKKEIPEEIIEEVEPKVEELVEEVEEEVKKINRKELLYKVIKDEPARRYKELKSLNEMVLDYSKSLKNKKATHPEKKILNKIIRELLEVKK